MSNEFIALASACFAVMFIRVLRIPYQIKKMIWGRLHHEHRIKPLDCERCLSLWIAVISAIYFQKNWVEVPYVGVTASVLAILITKYLNR